MNTTEHALATLRRAAEHGYPWSIYPAEARALVAEVERLRAECRTLQEWCEIAAEAENANADEARKERAAVVAWLRDCDTHCREHDGRENAVSATYRIAANVIERGEHRKEDR